MILFSVPASWAAVKARGWWWLELQQGSSLKELGADYMYLLVFGLDLQTPGILFPNPKVFHFTL